MRRVLAAVVLLLGTLSAVVLPGAQPAQAATLLLNASTCSSFGGTWYGRDCRWYNGDRELSVAAGDTVVVQVEVNYGTGPQVVNPGPSKINQGTIELRGGEFNTYYDTQNDGMIKVFAGSTLANLQDVFTNKGTIIVPVGAALVVDNAYGTTNNAGLILACPGTISGTLTGVPVITPSDCIAPTAAPTLFPAANAAGWNNSDVTVTWNWADDFGGRGLNSATCAPATTTVTVEGTTTLSNSCEDNFGNRGSRTQVVKVDKLPPSLSISSGILDGGSYVVGSVPAAPTCSATDARSGVTAAGCQVSGYSTAVGPHTITFFAADVAGNSITNRINYTVTGTAPTISGTPPSAVKGQPYSFGYTVSGIPDATVTLDSGSLPPNLSLSNAGAITGSPTATGTYNFRVKASNGINPDATLDSSITVNAAPTILGIKTLSVGTGPGSCSATVPPPLLFLNATGVPAPTVSFVPAMPGVFPLGSTSVTATASNGISPDASATFDVDVRDTEDPTIRMGFASPLVVQATSPSGAVVLFAAPFAADNCPGVSFVQTAGLASGATFPIGDTTVTFRATDKAGRTASVSGVVRVQQNDVLYPSNVVPPAAIALGTAYAVETAQRIDISCTGYLTSAGWYRTADDTGLQTVTVWRNGVSIASLAVTATATGWVSFPLDPPVPVFAGDRLLVGVHHPNGAYAYRTDGFRDRNVVSVQNCMNSPASKAGDLNGRYAYSGTPTLPTLSYASSEYFVNLGFSAGTGTTPTTTTSTTTTSTTTSTTSTTAPPTSTSTTTTLAPPSGAEQLYGTSVVPASLLNLGSAYPVVTGQRIDVNCNGSLTGIWWYKTASDVGPQTVSLWRGSTLLASGVGSPTATGWVFVPFSSSVPVGIGDRLVAGVHHPSGAYGTRTGAFTAQSLSSPSGCLRSPATSASAPNGLYAYGNSLTVPNLSYAASEYYVSPEFVPGPAPATTTTTTTTSTTTTTTAPPTTTTTTTIVRPGFGMDRLYTPEVVPPGQVAIGAAYPVETAQRIDVLCDGTIDGMWWYRIAADTGPSTVSVWRNNTLIASGSGAPADTGWVFVAFTSPVPVVNGDRLIVGVHHPNGAYATRTNGFTGRSLVSARGCLSSPASTALAPNGFYAYSATPTLPTLSYLASEYFITPNLVLGAGKA